MAPQRQVNNWEHFGKHGTAPLCTIGALKQGALTKISLIFGNFHDSGASSLHARFYREHFF
jgi:hypothetical protein